MCCTPCSPCCPTRLATIVIAILLSLFFFTMAVEEVASKDPFLDRIHAISDVMKEEAAKRGVTSDVATGICFFYFGASLFLLISALLNHKLYVLIWLIVFFPMLVMIVAALIALIIHQEGSSKVEGIVFYVFVLVFFACAYYTVLRYFLPLV